MVRDCTASNNVVGIFAGTGSTVGGNTVYDNEYEGIATNLGCTVSGNTAHSNGRNGILLLMAPR
jgi:parallel beta-helix repeat protein